MFLIWLLIAILLLIVVPIAIKLIRKYRKNIQAGNLPVADQLKTYLKVLKKDPNNTNALLTVGKAYYRNKDYENSFRYLDRLMLNEITRPDDFFDKQEANKYFGLAAYKMGKYKDALSALQLAHRKGLVGDFLASKTLGILFYKKRDYVSAVKHLSEALSLKPTSTILRMNLGLSYTKINEPEKAIEQLLGLIPQRPNNSDLRFALGESYEKVGSYEKAIEQYRAINDGSEAAHLGALNSAKLLLKLKEAGQAKSILVELRDTVSKSSDLYLEALYILANYHLTNHDLLETLNNLRSILEVKPEYKNTSELYQRYSVMEGNPAMFVFTNGNRKSIFEVCKRVVKKYSSEKKDFLDISTKEGRIDLTVKVRSQSWEEYVLFCFFKTNLIITERSIYDVFERMKELHVERTVVFSLKEFSEEAVKVTDARPIDLIGSSDFINLLKKVELSLKVK